METVPAGPQKRSIVLLGNCYYSFYYLAKALRKRGWNAISVSSEYPGNDQFYHSVDLNLWDQDSKVFKKNIEGFLGKMSSDYAMLQFYGATSFWPPNHGKRFEAIPWDFIQLKNAGKKIGFTPAGCNDGVPQSLIYKVTGGLCDKCIWQNNPEVCDNALSASYAQKLYYLCDLICHEIDWTTGIRSSEKGFSEPLTFCNDKEHWHNTLVIPEKYVIKKQSPEHLIVLSAFGNKHLRVDEKKDLKGSKAIISAIDRLISEGYPVQKVYYTNIPSTDMRYFQAQADIIVDQLNYGRYGSFAREGMMIGKPVIGKLSFDSQKETAIALRECPIINADEESIYGVLKNTIFLSAQEREEIGHNSREYMLKWHEADACAQRFEKVYDRLMQGLPPFDLSLFNTSLKNA